MTSITPIFNNTDIFNNNDEEIIETIDTESKDTGNKDTIFEKKTDLFGERRGKKTNTYIANWNIDIGELNKHLQNLKKSCACNGSIKTILYDNINTLVLHLQGNHIHNCEQYLRKNGVTNIYVKPID